MYFLSRERMDRLLAVLYASSCCRGRKGAPSHLEHEATLRNHEDVAA
nr:MAG: hypothetical protein [Molluscum contagiosum virus]